MNTEKIKLTQVSTNEKNPRRITDGNLMKLINSILVFPRMLELRPIVIDDAMIPLGGNMRIKALTHIAAMSIEQIKSQLQTVYDFTKKTKKQQRETSEVRWNDNGRLHALFMEQPSKRTKPIQVIRRCTGSGRERPQRKSNLQV